MPITKNTIVVVYTTHVDDESLQNSLKENVQSYIIKSTHPALISNLIDNIELLKKERTEEINETLIPEINSSSEPQKLLTVREEDVLDLLSKGFLYKEIAIKLKIATGTVKRHLHRIYKKLNVQNKTEAINKFREKS